MPPVRERAPCSPVATRAPIRRTLDTFVARSAFNDAGGTDTQREADNSQSASASPLQMTVAVVSRRRCRGVRLTRVRTDAIRLLRELGVSAELSVALVGDVEMRSLNATYRHIDRPTDVLAFALHENDPSGTLGPLLGDVVISLDTARRQALTHRVSLADEVRRLLTHGVLHLLGYDHQRSASDARRMFRKQRRLIAHLRATPT